jgi:hypothetical protein
MAFELPSGIPNFNVQQPQAPNLFDQYGKMLQLKQLIGDQKQQAIMRPLQQQQAEQSVQAATLENQQRQQEVQSQQAMVKAWSDPNFLSSVTGSDAAKTSGVGFDPDAMTKHLVTNGVLPKDAMAMTQQFVERSQKIAATQKDIADTGAANANTRDKGMKILADKIGGVLDAPTAKAGDMLATLKKDLVQNPDNYAGVPKEDLAHLFQADLEHLPAMATMIGLDGKIADFHKAKFEAAKAGQGVIPDNGGLSPDSQQQVEKDVAVATNPQVQAGKVAVAKAEATAREQVQAQMLPIMEQVRQQFANQKDARDKIETNVLKPFQDKMTDVTMARSAISQAETNPVSARAAIFKMVGVAQPTGSHRVLPMEFTAFKYPGGVTDQVKEKFNDFLSGKPWTPEIAQAANAFIDGQSQAAQTSLNSGIDNTNKLFGTTVGTALKQDQPAAAPNFFSKFGGRPK